MKTKKHFLSGAASFQQKLAAAGIAWKETDEIRPCESCGGGDSHCFNCAGVGYFNYLVIEYDQVEEK